MDKATGLLKITLLVRNMRTGIVSEWYLDNEVGLDAEGGIGTFNKMFFLCQDREDDRFEYLQMKYDFSAVEQFYN